MAPSKRGSARREVMGGLAKGLQVITAFQRNAPALALSEVAGITRLPPATARRCLLTLEELGYVMRSGRTFLLRPKVLELGAAYLDSMDIGALTHTLLEDLACRTGDPAALSVLDGTDIVYVAHSSARTLLRLEARVGSRFPAFATSMGRVLLAGSSPEALRVYFERATFTAFTKHTVVDPAKLERRIDEARRLGYASIEDELDYGVVAVAVPVFDASHRVIAALNSSSHSKKFSRGELARERVGLLQQISAEISRELRRFPGLALSAAR